MLNKVILMGRLCADPDFRQTTSGASVCRIRVAVERRFANKQTGEREADFINVVCWRQQAEFVSKYFTKGRMAVVSGRLQIRNWTDKEGNKRRSAEVVADQVYFGDSKRDGEGGGSYGGFGSSQRGEDLRAEISVSFDEAAFGCEKKISLQGQDGKISTVQVKIPAGIESGKTIRLRGKGMPGSNSAGDGDLLLKVDVQEKPGFERKGADLYTTVKIPFTTAVLGGEAEVATLTGKVVCRIKPGTQSGSRIRLKGKGIVSMKDASVHGDQYVTVQIDVPKNLSAAAKQKLREFEEACKGGSSRGAA